MRRILVVEDSPAIALLLRRRLEMAGHSVDVVPDGTHVVARLATELPDLVVADVMMPGLDGLETLKQIRNLHPGLPVVLVTGQELKATERREADAVFAKPIEFDRLLETIDRLTGSQGP